MATTTVSSCVEETSTNVPACMQKLLSESSELQSQSKRFEAELKLLESEIKDLISKYANHENTLDLLCRKYEENNGHIENTIQSYKASDSTSTSVYKKYEMISDKIKYSERFSVKTNGVTIAETS